MGYLQQNRNEGTSSVLLWRWLDEAVSICKETWEATPCHEITAVLSIWILCKLLLELKYISLYKVQCPCVCVSIWFWDFAWLISQLVSVTPTILRRKVRWDKNPVRRKSVNRFEQYEAWAEVKLLIKIEFELVSSFCPEAQTWCHWPLYRWMKCTRISREGKNAPKCTEMHQSDREVKMPRDQSDSQFYA